MGEREGGGEGRERVICEALANLAALNAKGRAEAFLASAAQFGDGLIDVVKVAIDVAAGDTQQVPGIAGCF